MNKQAQHGAQLRPRSWNSLLAVWDTKQISKSAKTCVTWQTDWPVKCVILDWPVDRLVWHLLLYRQALSVCHHVHQCESHVCCIVVWTSMFFLFGSCTCIARWCWGFRWGRSGPWATSTLQLVGLNLVDSGHRLHLRNFWTLQSPSPSITFSLSQVLACSSVVERALPDIQLLYAFLCISSMDWEFQGKSGWTAQFNSCGRPSSQSTWGMCRGWLWPGSWWMKHPKSFVDRLSPMAFVQFMGPSMSTLCPSALQLFFPSLLWFALLFLLRICLRLGYGRQEAYKKGGP